MYITIGQIVNTHGHKGEVKILPFTDDPKSLAQRPALFLVSPDEEKLELAPGRRQVHLLHSRVHKNTLVATLEEIETMNQAEALKWHYLQIPAEDLQPLPEGRYYIFQLVGLKVYEGGQYLGEISEVLQPGSNDVYVVKDPQSQREILIPALKDVIMKVDLEEGRMEVLLPTGLLD